MKQSSQIRTLTVVGGGALGQIIAARMAEVGVEVWLLCTERGAASLLSQAEIRLTGSFEQQTQVGSSPAARRVGVTHQGSGPLSVDGIIFTTKAHQLESAADSVAAIRTGWVAGVQNGVLKDEILAKIFGWQAVLGMATVIGGERLSDGRVLVTQPGHSYLGEWDARRTERALALANTLNLGGLPTEVVADIASVEWSKAANACATFGVSILARTPWSAAGADPDLALVFLSLIREVAALAAASGVQVGDYVGFPAAKFATQPDDVSLAELASWAASRPSDRPIRVSMHQDLDAGRSLEVEPVFGDLLNRARRIGIAVPRLEMVYRVARSQAIRPRSN